MGGVCDNIDREEERWPERWTGKKEVSRNKREIIDEDEGQFQERKRAEGDKKWRRRGYKIRDRKKMEVVKDMETETQGESSFLFSFSVIPAVF